MTLHGLLDLRLDRWQPWGASQSINEVKATSIIEDGSVLVEFAMQSGDKISLRATGRIEGFPELRIDDR